MVVVAFVLLFLYEYRCRVAFVTPKMWLFENVKLGKSVRRVHSLYIDCVCVFEMR